MAAIRRGRYGRPCFGRRIGLLRPIRGEVGRCVNSAAVIHRHQMAAVRRGGDGRPGIRRRIGLLCPDNTRRYDFPGNRLARPGGHLPAIASHPGDRGDIAHLGGSRQRQGCLQIVRQQVILIGGGRLVGSRNGLPRCRDIGQSAAIAAERAADIHPARAIGQHAGRQLSRRNGAA